MATTFSYSIKGKPIALNLRLDPNDVSWTYRLNTSVQDTFGGRIVQVLSCQVDTVTIEGQFGKEGPRGRVRQDGRWKSRSVLEQFDYETATDSFGIGLTQMTEFFRDYFAISTQGGEEGVGPGTYSQVPMVFTYGDITFPWVIMPTEFPSYQRSNEDFAPLWKVSAKVVEADPKIKWDHVSHGLERIQAIIGYKRDNPFSDPLAGQNAQVTLDQIAAGWKRALLPKFTLGDIQDLITNGLSFSALGIDVQLKSDPAATVSDIDDTIGIGGSSDLSPTRISGYQE
jgi:hypothetical protein